MSNARSPREVCSITIGINGLISLLASGGPQLRLGSGGSFFWRPKLLARLGELERDALDLGDDQVERLAHAEVVAQQLVPATGEDALDDFLGGLALLVGVLADELAYLVVADLDARLLRDRLERELAGARAGCLGAQARLEVLRGPVGDGDVGLERDPAPFERLD